MLNIIQALSEKLEKSLYGYDGTSTHYKSAEFWQDYYLAGDTATPAGRLAALAKHKDSIIRKRVAENLHIPSHVQRLLVNDQDIDVRLALTANPSTRIEIWKQLIEDESELVRFSLARNRNMPVPMLINLARDEEINIAGQAQQTIEEIFGTSKVIAA